MARPIDPQRIEVIDDATAEMFRRMSGAERVAAGFAMFDFGSRVIEASVRGAHPDWDDAAVRAEVARRCLGDVA